MLPHIDNGTPPTTAPSICAATAWSAYTYAQCVTCRRHLLWQVSFDLPPAFASAKKRVTADRPQHLLALASQDAPALGQSNSAPTASPTDAQPPASSSQPPLAAPLGTPDTASPPSAPQVTFPWLCSSGHVLSWSQWCHAIIIHQSCLIDFVPGLLSCSSHLVCKCRTFSISGQSMMPMILCME